MANPGSHPVRALTGQDGCGKGEQWTIAATSRGEQNPLGNELTS